MRRLSLFVTTLFTLSSPLLGQDFRVHSVTLPEVAFVKVFVVETSSHVVVIDAGWAPAHGEALLKRATALGKPVSALLLTHAHIDHYGGTPPFRAKGIPIVSSEGVARQVDEWDARNLARAGLGAPSEPRRPTRILGHGEALMVDGVRFVLQELGPGESYADSWWMIQSAGKQAAIIGDVAMYGIPPLMQSGHSGDWMRSLELLQRTIPPGTPIHIGHDVKGIGDPDHSWGPQVLAWQLDQLRTFRKLVGDVTKGTRLLTGEEIAQIVVQMNKHAPENNPAFGFLVVTSANVLASELIMEQQKAQFETDIRAVLRARRAP